MTATAQDCSAFGFHCRKLGHRLYSGFDNYITLGFKMATGTRMQGITLGRLSKWATALACVLFLPFSARSQPADTEMSVQEITRRALEAANAYAKGVSCVEAPANADGIAALTPYKKEVALDAAFLVFWVGDIGCNGGSATVTFNAALVRVGSFDSFYVDPQRSSPAINLQFNTRFMERLVGNTKDTIVVDADELASNDANCCASLRYRITLQVDKSGNWKEIKRKPLPPRK
jgi:hypothetical protein